MTVPSSVQLDFPVVETTSADGSFLLYGLQPGHLSLTVRHKEYRELALDLDLTAGRQDVQIVLERRRQFSVSGFVLDPEGRPFAGAIVTLWNDGTVFEATADARGAFTFPDCPEGPVLLGIKGFRLPPEESTLQVDRPHLGLVLHPQPR